MSEAEKRDLWRDIDIYLRLTRVLWAITDRWRQ